MEQQCFITFLLLEAQVDMETTNTTTTTNTTKKVTTNNNDQQVVIYDESFVILKSYSETLKSVISTWKETNGEYDSDFTVPVNREFRIKNLYAKLGCDLGKYTVSGDGITFDCLSKFSPEFFPTNAKSGWIHFLAKISETQDERVVNIDDRMVIEKLEEPISFEIEHKLETKFQAKNLKVFPINFVAGFALATVEKETAIMWVTVQDFSKMYCGTTNRQDLNNLIHNIMPVFPIFSVTLADKKSVVFLKLDGMKNLLSDLPFKKGLLRFEYNLSDPKKLKLAVIGKCED